MIYNVIWTPRAQKTFNINIEYLEQDWDQNVINDFFDRVKDVIEKISSDPKLFPLYNNSKVVHRCVVTQQITLYYKIIDRSRIDLITFWNVYQNPKKLKLK